MKKASTLGVLLFFCGFFVRAQGWKTAFGSPTGNDVFYDVELSQTGDGGLVFVGQTVGSDGSADAFFVRTNALGRPLAQKAFGETGADEHARAFAALADGSFLVAVNRHKNGLDSLIFQKLDARGELLFSKKATTEGVVIYGGAKTSDGDFVFCGQKIIASIGHLFLIKINSDGDQIWQKEFMFGDACSAEDLIATSDGGCVICGSVKFGAGNGSDANLLKINALGDLVWQKSYGGPFDEFAFGIAPTQSGGLVLAGFQDDGTGDSDALLAFYDSNGAFLGDKIFDKLAINQLQSAALMPDGSLVFCGSEQADATAKRDVFLMKTDPSGTLLFETKFGGPEGDRAWAIAAKTDGSIAVGGHFSRCEVSDCLDAAAIQTDANGAIFGGRIRGKVQFDADDDCLPDGDLRGWTVEARSGSSHFLAESRADGFFEIEAPIGAFDLRVLMPAGGVWQACLASVNIALVDSIEQNFVVKKAVDCPVLQVDLATDHLQKCDTSAYVLTLKNWGTTVAAGAKIRVAHDAFLQPTGASSLPFLTNGDTLIFDLGDVQSLDNQRLTFDLSLACGPNFDRQAHAVSAVASPAPLCKTPPNWDGSDLDARAFCDGDSVRIEIKNKGGNPTGFQTEFIIVEDILLRVAPSIPAPFATGGSIKKAFEADGSTFLVRARNTPENPSGTRPFAFVEGCKSGPFQAGFPLQFAQNDGLPQVEIDCREGWSGPDPDLLKAFPTGWGPQHLIEKEDAIDYLLRFQNATGAMAKRLEIRDTLSEFLDPTRIEIGAASHPFSLEWRGERTLVFVFDSIDLQDSARGFVKFRILPDSTAAIGSLILNRSAAYFDFAAAAFSNQTFHEINLEKNYLVVSATEPTAAQNMPVRVTPNPFSESCRVDWPGDENQFFSVRLTDLAGRVLIQKRTLGPRLDLEKGSLPSGLFLLQVIDNQQVTGHAKIILQ